MIQYAMLSWRPGDRSADQPLERAREILSSLTWSVQGQDEGLEVWTPTDDRPAVRLSPSKDGVLIGTLIGEPVWGGDPKVCARELCRRAWGRYVAIFQEPGGRAVAMLRDPSGCVEALSWRVAGLRIVATDLDVLLEALPPSELAIDWHRLGLALLDPIALAGDTPLRGVLAATPGALRGLDDGAETPAWDPVAFARQERADTAETRAALVGAVDASVSRLVRPGGRVVAELSGGLDSSIVAGALVRTPTTTVAQWLHYFVDDAAGDERGYARAAARHLNVTLTEAPKATFGLDLGNLAIAAASIRPSGAIADAHYDQDLAARCKALGAQQIFTGLGGDTVFLQGGGGLLAADDYWRGAPWRLGPALQVARHVRQSVWSVWRKAQAARRHPEPKAYATEKGHLAQALRSLPPRPPHPWMLDVADVAPAKRRQLMHLAYQMLVFGRTARDQQAEVVHPLLAQPVMEVCLSLSTRALTHGGDDRVMARLAFETRLAPEIVARRSKGDLGHHYGRAIAEDLDAIRDLLMDGELVGAGLVEPEALDEVLTRETLIWRGPYREIVAMIILEQWARSWTARLARLPSRRIERQVQPV